MENYLSGFPPVSSIKQAAETPSDKLPCCDVIAACLHKFFTPCPSLQHLSNAQDTNKL